MSELLLIFLVFFSSVGWPQVRILLANSTVKYILCDGFDPTLLDTSYTRVCSHEIFVLTPGHPNKTNSFSDKALENAKKHKYEKELSLKKRIKQSYYISLSMNK